MSDMQEYIEAANKQIAKLTKYGVREEIATVKSIRFTWSNAHANWWHWYAVYNKGEIVTLDANEFLLPFAGRKFMAEAEKHFDALPLYSNSFEYVYQGKRLRS